MPRQKSFSVPDDDSHPVIVPRNGKALVPVTPERVRRLHRHLVSTLLASQASLDQGGSASSAKWEPEGFAARVATAACTLCKGSCCRNGDDDAFLSENTMTRVRQAKPELDLVEVAHLYIQRVPDAGYENSCIFHGKQGCTLDRSLRSDVCNGFFCAGLAAFLGNDDPPAPVVIIAGEGDAMRTSPVLTP